MKRTLILVVAVLVGCLFLVGQPAYADEKPIKLHIASWNVPKDPNSKVLQAIADDLQKITNGMVTADISYKALGKPEDYYTAAANGICDIAYVGLPYTPGRFPLSEILGLPINFPDNITTTKAHYYLWQKGYLDKQFAEVQTLCVGSTSPYNFLWGKEAVTSLAGFKGKKIRCPGGPWTAMTEALGGVPVSVSPGETYMAVERGTIDGILQTWPAVPVFKLNEVCSHVTELNLSGFGFAIVMNKGSYEKLPKEARDMLKDNAEKYSLMMGEVHQGFNSVGMKMMKEKNATLDTLSPDEYAQMMQLFKPIFASWSSRMADRGLPGEQALDDLYVFLQGLGVKEPFVK